MLLHECFFYDRDRERGRATRICEDVLLSLLWRCDDAYNTSVAAQGLEVEPPPLANCLHYE